MAIGLDRFLGDSPLDFARGLGSCSEKLLDWLLQWSGIRQMHSVRRRRSMQTLRGVQRMR